MAASKIAITIENNLLKQINILVKTYYYPNRIKAVQEAVAEKLMRLEKSRHARESTSISEEHI